jgi:hypothetical protein
LCFRGQGRHTIRQNRQRILRRLRFFGFLRRPGGGGGRPGSRPNAAAPPVPATRRSKGPAPSGRQRGAQFLRHRRPARRLGFASCRAPSVGPVPELFFRRKFAAARGRPPRRAPLPQKKAPPFLALLFKICSTAPSSRLDIPVLAAGSAGAATKPLHSCKGLARVARCPSASRLLARRTETV